MAGAPPPSKPFDPTKKAPPPTTKKKKPGITLPPGSAFTPSGQSARDTFLAWAVKNGFDKSTAADVWYWGGNQAGRTNLDPTQYSYYLAAVLLAENNGKHTDPDGKVTDNGQAVGIGQISKGWIGHQIPWETNGVNFTNDDNGRTGLLNYGVNLRMAAYYLADGVTHKGYNGAYVQWYNPKDPKRGVAWDRIQKTLGTVDKKVGPWSPTTGPGTGASPGTNPEGKGKTKNANPFILGVTDKGKLTFTDDQTKALTLDGLPMKLSDWHSLGRQLETYFVSYTGGRPSNKVLLSYVNKGWSPYTLTKALAQNKNFKNSPIYKKLVPEFQEAAKSVMAPGEALDKDTIRNAVVNGWSPSELQAVLRTKQNYVFSNEFKQNTVTLLNVHQSIMGMPNKTDLDNLKQAALAGWSTDQYAAYLRGSPTYTASPEYQSKTLSFLTGLGLITGQNPVLKKSNVYDKNTNPSMGSVPDDKRLPTGSLSPAEDTVATYG